MNDCMKFDEQRNEDTKIFDEVMYTNLAQFADQHEVLGCRQDREAKTSGSINFYELTNHDSHRGMICEQPESSTEQKLERKVNELITL